MAVETNTWGILYCPKAGITNKRKRWEKIQKVLDERKVEYDFVQSETPDSVERLIRMMISNGYKTIVIVGGDSALNDAVNCLMMEEQAVRDSIALGVIPNGVMDDFARFWGIDGDDIEKTVDMLISHRIRQVDLGCIRYTNAKGEKCHRYFLNCINIGMTADIMNLRRQTRRLFGSRTLSFFSHGVQDETEDQFRCHREESDDSMCRLRSWLWTDTECRTLQWYARCQRGLSP